MNNTITRQDVLDFEEKVRQESIAAMHKLARNKHSVTVNPLYKKGDSYSSMLGDTK